MSRRPVRNYKCYALFVLAASLAVSAAVSIVLAMRSPAHIRFSVTSFTRNTSRDDDGGGGWLRLSSTLAAKNTSPSASVLYRSIYVLLCNRSISGLVQGRICIGTDVTPLLPPRQGPGSSKRVDAAVEMEGAGSPWVILGVMPSMEDFGGDTLGYHGVLVNVSALVRFKRPGLPWASLHDIKVLCPIDMFQGHKGAAASALVAVECVG